MELDPTTFDWRKKMRLAKCFAPTGKLELEEQCVCRTKKGHQQLLSPGAAPGGFHLISKNTGGPMSADDEAKFRVCTEDVEPVRI
jgi:hypothetical protein